MIRRPQYIALSLVVVAVLILLNLPQDTAARLKLALGSLFLPLFGLAGSAQSATEKAGDNIVPRSDLAKEITQLRRQNDELRVELERTREATRENSQLRQQLGLPKQIPWKLKFAHVIGREPANWWRAIHINLGSRDGLKPNMAVITTEGLVGRVASVAYSHSQVLLVGDQNCRVSALIQETRDHGIVAPSSSSILDPTLVDLTYLPRNSAIKPGQIVATSGQGGVFPKGILIGTIADTRSMGYDLYTEARLKLAVDSGKLEHVWVILQ